MVDLVNHLDRVGEDPSEVLERLKARVVTSDIGRLTRAVSLYGTERAKRYFGREVVKYVAARGTD